MPLLVGVVVLVLLATGGLIWALAARASSRVAALEQPLASSGDDAVVPGTGALRFGEYEVDRVRVEPDRDGRFVVDVSVAYRGENPAAAGFLVAEVRDAGRTVGRVASPPLLFEPGVPQQVELRGGDEFGLHDDVAFALWRGLPPGDPLGRREVSGELLQEQVTIGPSDDGTFVITARVWDSAGEERQVHLVAEVLDGETTVGALATVVAMHPDELADVTMRGVGPFIEGPRDVLFRAYTVN